MDIEELLKKLTGPSAAIKVRNGKRSYQFDTNNHDLDTNYDFDIESDVYSSKHSNKYGAKDSFAESNKIELFESILMCHLEEKNEISFFNELVSIMGQCLKKALLKVNEDTNTLDFGLVDQIIKSFAQQNAAIQLNAQKTNNLKTGAGYSFDGSPYTYLHLNGKKDDPKVIEFFDSFKKHYLEKVVDALLGAKLLPNDAFNSANRLFDDMKKLYIEAEVDIAKNAYK